MSDEAEFLRTDKPVTDALETFQQISPARVAESFDAFVRVFIPRTSGVQEDEHRLLRVEGEVRIEGREYALHYDIDPKYMSIDHLCRRLKDAEKMVLDQLGRAIQKVAATPR